MTGDPSTSETVPEAASREPIRIGVLSPLLGGTFFGRVLAGIARVGGEAGARVVAIQTLDLSMGGHTARVPRYEQHAAWERVNGFVVVLNAVNHQYLDHLRHEGKPVVMVSHEVAGFKCPVVQPDNHGGAFAATSHLIDHGHRRIAFVGNFFQTDIRERYEAYREALLSHGIEPDPDLLIETADNLEESGEEAARRLLAAGLPSTAVLAATDFNAIGLMRALRAAGLVLPRDQAVAGFDDDEAASSLRPTLSSVHMGSEELGREAARLLLEMVWDRGVHDGPHRVATAFVPREFLRLLGDDDARRRRGTRCIGGRAGGGAHAVPPGPPPPGRRAPHRGGGGGPRHRRQYPRPARGRPRREGSRAGRDPGGG